MPGLCNRSANCNSTSSGYCSSSSPSSNCSDGSCISNARKGIWSRSCDDITFAQLNKFWSDLSYAARQELLRIDKQSFFEQVRKNLYCSRCNGLLLEVFSQVVHYGKSLQHDVTYSSIGGAAVQNRKHNGNGSKFTVPRSQDDASDPSVHPWGGLTATRDGVLTLLDSFLVGTSLEALQNVFDSARARERERELLYPDACGGGGRGWISQATSISGRAHGIKETCALHTARLSCEALVDFWSALGEETRLSLLRMKEEDFIERLMFRFDSKRFCRECRRNVLRELKELKRTRREPRCNMWFCVADTAFQYEVSDSTVQADWHEWFAEAGGIYQHFEWAIGTGEGKSDILGFADVGLSESVQADGLALDSLSACYVTLRAWRHDGRCTEISVKAHALEGRSCVHKRLIVADGYVTITKGESIQSFFEHAEETEEEEDEESNDRDGNDVDSEGSRFQKHAKSPELARDFLLDAATVIFKEQVEKAFREGTARQNAHSIFVCVALGLLEDRVHIACKEIITLEKQNKLLEEEAAEKREEEERKERKRLKERERKLKRREKLKGKDKEKENSYESKDGTAGEELASSQIPNGNQECFAGTENGISTEDTKDESSSFLPMSTDEVKGDVTVGKEKGGKDDTLDVLADVEVENGSREGCGAFIFGQSKSARRKSKVRKGTMAEMSSARLFRNAYTSMEFNSHVKSSEYIQPPNYYDTGTRPMHGVVRQPKSLKSENIGKVDSRNSVVKCYEKMNLFNGRSQKHDYSFCGCNPQNPIKFLRENRSDRADSSLDFPRNSYRISNHAAGSASDHYGAVKGKVKLGLVSGSRGDFVPRKVWEPLDSRQQGSKSSSQTVITMNTTSQRMNPQIKNESSHITPAPRMSNHTSIHCDKLRTCKSSENGHISSEQGSKHNCEKPPIISNLSKDEEDSSSDVTMQQNDDNIQTSVTSSTTPISSLVQSKSDTVFDATMKENVDSIGSSLSSLSTISTPVNHDNVKSNLHTSHSLSVSTPSRNVDGSMFSPSFDTCSEKLTETATGRDASSKKVAKPDCEEILDNNSVALHIPLSSNKDIHFVDAEENNSKHIAVNSSIVSNLDNVMQSGPLSTSDACEGIATTTRSILTNSEINSTPQLLPVCIPSIAPSVIPLHSHHQQGYYQCGALWHPVSSNGLLQFPQPNGFVYPGQGTFGLSSGRSPGFSTPYLSSQQCSPLLSASHVMPFTYEANTTNHSSVSSSCRSGDSEIGAIKFHPNVNISEPEKHNPLRESSSGLSPLVLSSQDAIPKRSSIHDTSNFSLFHFGGPEPVRKKEEETNGEFSNAEIFKGFLNSNDSDASLLSRKDFISQQEQAPVEEYTLFSTSSNQFPFFNQVH